MYALWAYTSDRILAFIPRLSENAKNLSLEAVNTEPLGASYFRKIKLIRYTLKINYVPAFTYLPFISKLTEKQYLLS